MESLSELKDAVSTLLDYNYDEKKHWMECVYSEMGPDYELSGYDPSLCPDHIYHTIRKLEKFIAEPGE